MQKLVSGIHKFHSSVFTKHQDLFKRLATGQAPGVLLITCSDSRIDPTLVLQADPGDLFIVRNAGNLIPGPLTCGSGELASIEFAIEALKVQDVVVCGHTDCGAMKAVIGGGAPGMTHVGPWLQHADRTRTIIDESYQHLEGRARVNAAAEENVLVQIEQLVSHEFVAKAWREGRIRIHGWMYHVEQADIFTYDHETHEFHSVRANGVSPIQRARAGGARTLWRRMRPQLKTRSTTAEEAK